MEGRYGGDQVKGRYGGNKLGNNVIGFASPCHQARHSKGRTWWYSFHTAGIHRSESCMYLPNASLPRESSYLLTKVFNLNNVWKQLKNNGHSVFFRCKPVLTGIKESPESAACI